jgi:hypothetical protein
VKVVESTVPLREPVPVVLPGPPLLEPLEEPLLPLFEPPPPPPLDELPEMLLEQARSRLHVRAAAMDHLFLMPPPTPAPAREIPSPVSIGAKTTLFGAPMQVTASVAADAGEPVVHQDDAAPSSVRMSGVDISGRDISGRRAARQYSGYP